MKKFISIICAILFNGIMGATLAGAVGVSPFAGALGINLFGALVGHIGMPDGLRAGVLTEVWTGELIGKLRSLLDGSWLDGITDASALAKYDVIHLGDIGADPEVLVNNKTYPIEVQELEDGDKAISLDKFNTKATPVTDDELYALSYDKMTRVRDSHSSAINEKKFAKAAHSIASEAHKVATSGAPDPVTGRHALTIKDIIAVKAELDKLKVPADSRRLVLTPDHINDLLGISESFAKQYNIDTVNGRVARLMGFDIYEYGNCPVFNSSGIKQALGTAEGSGKFSASFAFYAPRVFKATGSTKMYYSEAASDPLNQRNLINFRHYFIAMPKKDDAMVTLYNGYTSKS